MPTQKKTDYSATPLPKKLGIVSSAQDPDLTPREIALLAIPEGFEDLLGLLPPHLTFNPRVTRRTRLALCFVRTPSDLEAIVHLLATRLPRDASAWIIHPKPKPLQKPHFNQNDVRNAALARNLVDFKVASITPDWSGLKFNHRKS